MSLHENMLSRGGLATLFFIVLTFFDPDLIKCEYFSMTVLMSFFRDFGEDDDRTLLEQ